MNRICYVFMTSSYFNYPRFDVNNLSQDECKTEFRFEKAEIPVLAEALQIPNTITCVNGAVASGIEGLCMLLKRFWCPSLSTE